MKALKLALVASICLAGTSIVVLPATGSASSKRTARAGHGARAASLTVAVAGPPQSLDPSHDDNGDGLYPAELLYGSLINETNSGKFIPGIATTWHYVGTGNKQFELTLRSGVHYSDGTLVTPASVAASLNYFTEGSGPTTGDMLGVHATVAGPHQVLLTSKTPNPIFPNLLSPQDLAGDIVCPASLKNPKSLADHPCGAGPYVLSSSGTIPGQQYTFTPDKNYYDPSQIHYNQIVIKVIANPASALNALRTGQVDFFPDGVSTLLPTAKAAGVKIINEAGRYWVGAFIFDRGGAVTKALSNVLVRQAMNYAVNRPAITKAVFGNLGTPDDEPTNPGWDEYVPSLMHYYTYNPAKAKQLLAKAGYRHGFTVNFIYPSFEAQDAAVIQAMANEWQAVGITTKLKAEPNITAFVSDQNSKKYSLGSLTWGSQPMFLQVGELWKPGAVANPLDVQLPSFMKQFAAASAAPSSKVTADMQALSAITIKDAFTVPVSAFDIPMMAVKGLNGLPRSGAPLPGGVNLLNLYG